MTKLNSIFFFIFEYKVSNNVSFHNRHEVKNIIIFVIIILYFPGTYLQTIIMKILNNFEKKTNGTIP